MSELEPTRTYSNPTATEVLRRMLDERGVEWWEATPCKTKWSSPILGGPVAAREWNGEMVLDTGYTAVTPEQAIAATLGAGTCEADETDLIPFVRADSGDFEVDYIHVMECSSCGGTYEYVNGSYEFLPPKYCPNCGRRIEQ